MIALILCLHYLTLEQKHYHHAFYRMLFYFPLLLGSFWFGLKGSVSVFAAVFVLYVPYVTLAWEGLSAKDFDRLLEGGLYLVIALVTGWLVERERKKSRALLKARSLAAVGKTVSEVAHDMKNPLMAIGGFANQVARNLKRDDPNRKKLELVLRETSHLESLVREMLDFGRPLQLDLEEVDLNDVVRESTIVSEPLAKKHHVELKMGLGKVGILEIDADRLKQVFSNLLANAFQASPSKGTVNIRTSRNGPWAVVEVEDRGSGIPAEHEQEIFEPFYTTKKDGTGLGLPISRKIVEAHGGKLSFRPRTGKGTIFSVHLPV